MRSIRNFLEPLDTFLSVAVDLTIINWKTPEMSRGFVQLLNGKVEPINGCATAADVKLLVHNLHALPVDDIRLISRGKELTNAHILADDDNIQIKLRIRGGGGDTPDWTESGHVMTSRKRKKLADARPPDWSFDPSKYEAKIEREKRERGELVISSGPFCVPCGKRFAKQSVYDAHLSGQKHYKALLRAGRMEEAAVCRLDIEAKKRRLVHSAGRECDASGKATGLEEFRRFVGRKAMHGGEGHDALRGGSEGGKALRDGESHVALRCGESREEVLRRRWMLPMPGIVSASYNPEEEEARPNGESS